MTPVKQTMKIGAGIVVLLIGVALMMPAAVQVRQEGMVEFAGLCYAVFGIALLITGALVAFWPYKKRKA
jgi:predicted tellurium resistance membrane protein TerC